MFPRINLPEIEDQQWCPHWIRNCLTEYLEGLFRVFKPYKSIYPKLHATLERVDTLQIIDLCSGSGGPIRDLQSYFSKQKKQVSLMLTDQYPPSASRIALLNSLKIDYFPTQIDARKVPSDLVGFRTIFTALHHFRQAEAKELIASAVRDGHGFAAFEVTERSLRGLLVALVTPILVIIITPFLRPFRKSRMFFTYIVPLLPLLIAWDGLASMLKSYSRQELLELSAEFPQWHWEVGSTQSGALLPVKYLIGTRVAPL